MTFFKRALAAALFSLAFSAQAQTGNWPNKPVRVIVPFAPGAGTDVIMRYFAQFLSESLKQSVVVENRPGANGMIGTAAGAKADPDGYTFFVISNSTISAAPGIYKTVPYDIEKDIQAVAPFILAPSLLLAHPDFPADNLDQFLTQVRTSKDKLAYAHANSVGLVAGSALRSKADLDLVDVPYKSSPQALADVMGGQIAFVIVDTIASTTALKGNKVKALAVTSAQRSPLYPEVAALSEKFPGIDSYAWVGLGAPAGTPAAIIDRMNEEIVRISQDKKTIEYFENMGASMHPMSSAKYVAFVREQNTHWSTQLRDAGVQPQ